MDPLAFAISSHIVAKDKFLYLASFRAAQTTEICSHHPGTFFIQPFCTDLFINLLLLIKCVSRHLETNLKKSLPSTFIQQCYWTKIRDVMFSWRFNFWDINFLGAPPLEWYYVHIHTRKKDFKKKLIYFRAFFVDVIGYSIKPRS